MSESSSKRGGSSDDGREGARVHIADRLAHLPHHADCSELLTIPAASRRLGIGPRQLRRAVARGELDTYRIGGWPRLRWSKVLSWLESRRVPTTSHARRRVAEVLAREARKSC